MNRKSYLAGLLVLPLGLAELVEFKQPCLVALKGTAIDAGESDTLTSNPHTHSDFETEISATTVSPFFASGARHTEETFRLHVVPQQAGGFRLVAYSALNLWVTQSSEIQNMYGFCEDVESLTNLLTSRLGLPQSQVAAIRKTTLEGREQEIGGYVSMRVFHRGDLEHLGMSFRPPEA